MKAIAIDTETSHTIDTGMQVPFIITTCDESLNGETYFPRTVGLYKEKKGWQKPVQAICGDPNILKIFHNAAYDIAMLNNLGIDVVEPWFDTMIAASILNENFDPKGLKPLAKKYLNDACEDDSFRSEAQRDATKEARALGILGKDEDLPWHFIPQEALVPYALKDPLRTMKLYYLFRKPLAKFKKLFNFEMSLVPVVVAMYRNGMKLDRNFVQNTLIEYETEQAVHIKKLHKMVKSYGVTFPVTKIYKRYPKFPDRWAKLETQTDGTTLATAYLPFNPNSPAHKSKILSHLGVPITVETKTGLSTDRSVIEPFADKYPFIATMLESGWYEKQLTTYYRPFLNEHTTDTQPIGHFSYYQSAAKSGRFTAERIHQIPRMDESQEDPRVIRHCFIPSDENSWLVPIDYDQIEMRLFAHYTRSKLLLSDFIEGRDPYLQVAINVGKRLGIDVESMAKADKKEWRRKGKQCCLGVIYGMGKDKTAATLKLSPMQALEFLRYFYHLYPVAEYMQKITSQLYRTGVINVSFKSELLDFSRDFHVPQELAYKGVNIIMQSTAGYVMKAGMIRVWDAIQTDRIMRKHVWNVRTNLPEVDATIHDELIFGIHNISYDGAVDITNKLTEIMSDRVTFRVPITASPKISNKSWGAAKSIPGNTK